MKRTFKHPLNNYKPSTGEVIRKNIKNKTKKYSAKITESTTIKNIEPEDVVGEGKLNEMKLS